MVDGSTSQERWKNFGDQMRPANEHIRKFSGYVRGKHGSKIEQSLQFGQKNIEQCLAKHENSLNILSCQSRHVRV